MKCKCTKLLCWFGFHKYEDTDWLSKPYNVTPYRRHRYLLLQCTRCCKIKNGDAFLGQVSQKKNKYARPLKNCKI